MAQTTPAKGTAPAELDSFKPGQAIRVTVTRAARTDDEADTIQRLMRQDPGVRRGLRKAQRSRRQNMVVYNRGNRDWYKRESCSKLVRSTPGTTWTMTYALNLAPDFRAILPYVSIQAA